MTPANEGGGCRDLVGFTVCAASCAVTFPGPHRPQFWACVATCWAAFCRAQET
jgi:hypothetical protein